MTAKAVECCAITSYDQPNLWTVSNGLRFFSPPEWTGTQFPAFMLDADGKPPVYVQDQPAKGSVTT